MKKVVYLMLVLFITGVVGTLVTVSASGGFSLDTYNVHDKTVVNNVDITKIEIDLSSSDVTFNSTDSDDITVEMNGKISKNLKKKLKLDVKEKGETLKIGLTGEDQIKFNIGVLIVDTNVEVFLPQKVYESIQIDTSSGDILIQDLKAKETLFETSSGDIIARNLYTEVNRFHSSSGDMELSNVTGDIRAESSSGDMIIDFVHANGNIDAKTSSGDVSVTYQNEPNSIAIDFQGSSGEGDVSLDGVSFEEKSEHAIKGIIGSGHFKLKVETASGDFSLR
jgi:lia operon protein LiaG